MQGVKKEAFKLRKKRSQIDTQPRPKPDTSGQCVICGRFMEHLVESQCKTPECKALAKKLCIERGIGISAGSMATGVLTYIKTEPLVVERRRWYDGAAVVYDEMNNHECKCGRALKMPRGDCCALCYREANVKRMNNSGRVKISSKIKGLDKIKL